jgi:hypothetical protein
MTMAWTTSRILVASFERLAATNLDLEPRMIGQLNPPFQHLALERRDAKVANDLADCRLGAVVVAAVRGCLFYPVLIFQDQEWLPAASGSF